MTSLTASAGTILLADASYLSMPLGTVERTLGGSSSS